MKKTIDIQKKYNKKTLKISKEKLIEVIQRNDVSFYLDKETHFNNGESELVLTITIQDNFH